MSRSSPERRRGGRSSGAYLWGASSSALIAMMAVSPAFAQSAAIMRGVAGIGVVVPATASTPVPSVAPNMAAMTSATARAMRNQARVQTATNVAAEANAAARAAAQSLAQVIPNGLGAGGLDPVRNGVAAALDPTGLNVWQGAAAPVQTTNGGAVTVTVKQTDERALLSWNSFNVGRDTTLVFDQKVDNVAQTNWVVLNRVVAGINPLTGLRDPSATPTPSQIFGSIKADGTVLVLNPNGVLFGATSQVNLRSLVASSLDIGRISRQISTPSGQRDVPTTIAERNTSFLQSGLINSLSPTLLSAIGVQNDTFVDANAVGEGDVRVEAGASIKSSGGFVILAAPKVVNAGQLSATAGGQVSLQSGRAIDIRPSTGAADSIDPDVRGLVVVSSIAKSGAPAESDEPTDSVENAATGIIDAPLGYVSLGATYTGAVTHAGVLSSTTSVARNGKISLTGANVTLAPNAVIAITPDTGAETIPQGADSVAAFKTSKIEIGNRLIDPALKASASLSPSVVTIGSDALIYAPSAEVNIGDTAGASSHFVGEVLSAPSRVDIASGAVIDVSGVKDFLIDASRNSIAIDPAKRNELRDTPNYRDPQTDGTFTLNGTTLFVDPRLSGVREDGVAWVGSPLIEAASYYAQVGVTASELMTRGGSVTIGVRGLTTGVSDPLAAPSVNLAEGASIDFSGGWVRYEDGFVQTSRLLTADGRVVDIGNADPNDNFVGVVSGFTETQARFGVSRTFANPLVQGNGFELGYTEGRDAGRLTIKASTETIAADIHGESFPGTRQIADARPGSAASRTYGDIRGLQASLTELPSGGLLQIQALTRQAQSDDGRSTTGGGDIVVYHEGTTAPERDAGQILLSDALLSNSGLTALSLQTSGGVSFTGDSVVRLGAGGGMTVDAGRTISFAGDIIAPSGKIAARTYGLQLGSLFTDTDDKPDLLFADAAIPKLFDINVDGTISTRGLWTNDSLVTDGTYLGSAYTDGGAISLTVAPRIAVAIGESLDTATSAADLSGSIRINEGALLDVSAGGYVDASGDLSLDARGGDVSLVNETTFFQLEPSLQTSSFGVDRFGIGLTGFQISTDGQRTSALVPNALNSVVAFAPGTIRGHGFSGGGTFRLVTPDLNFGDAAGETGTAIPLDFISSAGFGAYDLTAWNTRILPNVFNNGVSGATAILGTEQVRIGAGQTLNLSQSLMPSLLDASQIAAVQALATGGDIRSLLAPTVPVDAWDQRAVALSFGGLVELDVEQGGTITGSAGSSITTPKLLNEGTIRIAGGRITQRQSLPLGYTNALRPALGVTDLAEVFGLADANGLFDESAPNALGITANTGPDSPVLSNRDLLSAPGLDRMVYSTGLLGADEGIRLADGSVTDLSGASIHNPRARILSDGRQLVTGRLVNGGIIETLGDFFDPNATFVTTPQFGPRVHIDVNSNPLRATRLGRSFDMLAGARLDLSGASDSFDIDAGNGDFQQTAMWSGGGRLSALAGGTIGDVEIDAAGGAAQAIGGTIEWLDPVLRQTVADTPVANSLSADMIEGAGFDSFIARRSLNTDGDVTLNLGRSFFLQSRPLTGNAAEDNYRISIGATGALTVNAPYVRFESLARTVGEIDPLAIGAGSAAFNADAIDIAGGMLFDASLGDVRLNAAGDVRMIGVQPLSRVLDPGSTANPSLTGQLVVTGDLTVTAGQVYPTTGTGDLQQLIDAERAGKPLSVEAFTIASTGADGTVRFERSSAATPATPYSAGGNLLVQAANIVQNGVLRAPMGRLTLGANSERTVATSVVAPATRSVTIGAGSITSVSAYGLSIPYGTTTDLIEYFFAPTSTERLTAPPSGELRLAGDAITVTPDATVDTSGGGDLFGYEFVSGTGGSRDVLSRFNSDAFSSNDGFQYADGRQVYAILPSRRGDSAALYDPIYSADYGDLYGSSGVGRSVFLDAAPGIEAGWYTLLPGRYAMLPGALRLVENVGAEAPVAGVSTKLLDGSIMVGGTYGVGGGSFAESQRRLFTVQDQATFLQYSRIELTSATKSFTALATANGTALPRLAADAARLVIDPVSELSIGAQFVTAPATGGRGAQVDIGGTDINIVAPGLAPAGTGGVTLTTSDIANLNAASLLIGGIRSDRADGSTELALTAHSINVATDAANPLSAPEILLGVDGLNTSINVADGSAIVATGTLGDTRDGAYMLADGHSGMGALLRVANGVERLIDRSDETSRANSLRPAGMTIGSALFSGDSLLLDSSRDLVINPSVSLNVRNIALGGDDIFFTVADPSLRGLVVTPELEAKLAAAERLTLTSKSVIAFSAGEHLFNDLRLNARGLRPMLPGDAGDPVSVTIRADDVTLENTDIDRGECATITTFLCSPNANSFAIEADTLRFAGGPVHVYGASGGVRLAARGGISYDGQTKLDVDAAPLTIDAPFVADRALTKDPRDAAVRPGLTLLTSGAVTVRNSFGASPELPTGTPGVSLSIGAAGAAAASVSISDVTLRATAGTIDIRAEGAVDVAGSSVLAMPGYSRTFGDAADLVRVSAPGGLLKLVSQSGDLTIGSASRLLLGGGDGKAGSLVLSAANGAVTLDGAIDAAAPEGKASFALDTGGLFDFSAFVNDLAESFTGKIAIRAGEGDLLMAAGQQLAAESVRLTADGGQVDIAGVIDTAGVNGGDIALFGAGGVALRGSALLDAHADGYAESDTRSASGGDVTLGVADDGAILVEQGARIDVGARREGDRLVADTRKDPVTLNDVTTYSFVEGDKGGSVLFRAPVIEQPGADSVNVSFGGVIGGASEIAVEGYKQFELGALASDPRFTGVQINAAGQAELDLNATAAGRVNVLADNAPDTLVDFVQSFDISGANAGLGDLLASPVFHARPGMELAYTGDILLNSNWNLGAGAVDIPGAVAAGLMAPSPLGGGRFEVVPGREAELFRRFTSLTYRVGGKVDGEAGVLSLRAGGNLDLRHSISDGFFAFSDQTDPGYISYQLGGGDRTYHPAVSVACGTPAAGFDCSILTEYYYDPNRRPVPLTAAEAVTIVFSDIGRGTDVLPGVNAPYSVAANAPGARGLQADGAGDPIGSAVLFPLLADGSAVDSFSLRLVGGARDSVDPNAVNSAATGNLILSGESHYQLAVTRGVGRYDPALQLRLQEGVPLEDSYLASTQDFLAGLVDRLGLDPEFALGDRYTRIMFQQAPAAVRELIKARAAEFFADRPEQFQFFGQPATGPTSFTTSLSLAMQFLQSIETELGMGIASGALGYAAPRTAELEGLANRNVFARSVVRTGTGWIDVAAAGDVDLRDSTKPVFRNESNRVVGGSNIGAAQVGGTAIYTAGHRVEPGLVQARVAGTSAMLSVDPTAYAAPAATPSTDYKPYFDGVLQGAAIHATGGGSIFVSAGRDILARRDVWSEDYGSQVDSDPDFQSIGSGDQRWRTGTIGQVTDIRINPQLFSSGIGALAGGHVTLVAGRDISDLTTAIDTSVVTADIGGARGLMSFGGGSLDMTVGRSILGGRIDLASGEAAISAGGGLIAAPVIRLDAGLGSGARPLLPNLMRIRLSDAEVAVNAGGSVDLAGVSALGVYSAPSLYNPAGFYTGTSALSIVAGGDVSMANAGRSLTTRITVNNETANVSGVVLPTSFGVVGFNGDLDLSPGGEQLLLYPGARGRLSLLSGGDIAPVTIAMDDGDASLLPGALSAFNEIQGVLNSGRFFGFPGVTPGTSDALRRLFHSEEVQHRGDADPIRIHADGDISRMTLAVPKQARVSAGRDIVDMMFFGQNLAASDITRITAGRDIIGTSQVVQTVGAAARLPALQGNNFVIGGPGSFFIEAGQNLGPFLNSATIGDPSQSFAGGVVSVGNEYNPSLGGKGADIYALFGVGKGAAFDALRDFYVDPANVAALDDDLFVQTTDINGNRVADRSKPIYAPILLDWMKSQAADALLAAFGTTDVTVDQAYAAFADLPTLLQRQFLIKNVYFNELAAPADPNGASYLQYVRGYRAVETLFPASLGYTENELTGAANGGTKVETGNLDLRLAAIETSRGGDVSILGPGGRVLGGSVVRTSEQAARRGYAGGGNVNALFNGGRGTIAQRIAAIPIGYEGVLTLRGGAIRSFTDGDFLLNQSRVFTQQGGDITMWSSNGDLNAGQGPKGAANFPPVVIRFDPNAFSEADNAGAVSGAGIAAFQPAVGVTPPNVTLIAPAGTVDAGDAGVRAAGNVFVAAAQVANADNFQVGGDVSGVPSVSTAPAPALPAGADAAITANVFRANDGAGSGDQRSRITVDVLGYAAGADDCKDANGQPMANCPAN
jgi:filamentous hemagglutinin family protein